MKKGIQVLLFVLLTLIVVDGQVPYLNNYDGIPIIAHTNMSARNISTSQLSKMRELGVLGFYATDLNDSTFNNIKASGLKMFPYQIWTSDRWIVYYTDAIYTKWEAEGKGTGENGDMELKCNYTLGDSSTDGTIKWIETKNNAPEGELTYGPGYFQYIGYKQLSIIGNPSSTILYTANYRLKVQQISNLPSGYLDSVVCQLQVVASNNQIVGPTRDTVIYSRNLTVNDFLTLGWNQWNTFSFSNYNLSVLQPPSNYDSGHMQYKVMWKGRTFLKLFVDYIEISDQKARQLKDSLAAKANIESVVNHYRNLDASAVLGFFGLNEPSSIDNYEPFRIVENIIDSITNSQFHLYTTFTTGWTGTYGGAWPGNIPNGYVFKGTEFYKRSKLPFISYNNYMYNWPRDSSFYLWNIDENITGNLEKFVEGNVPLSYSTQSGKFYQYEDGLETEYSLNSHVPLNAQMNYHINLGLLFGMKELTCDPFFTLSQDGRPYRIGLVDDTTLTSLGQFWKETIKPRMSGVVGKTIKSFAPTLMRWINQDANQPPSLNTGFVNTIATESNTQQKQCILDLGFFSGGGKSYFMVVNRYYSEWEKLKFYFQGLGNYKNWEVTNLVSNKKTTKVSDNNFEATYIDTIHAGDVGLFIVLPILKYGGTMVVNESDSGNLQIEGNINVPNNVILTIGSGSAINFVNQGFITNSGVLNLGSNVTVSTNDWSRSVLLCNSGTNPKLVWGAHPSFATTYYKVYRSGSNTPVSDPSTLTYGLIYTSPNASTRSFTDNDIQIGSAGQYIYYYVTACRLNNPKTGSWSQSGRSNYTSVHGGMYKKNNQEETQPEKIFSFSLDQNYPNPFNPVTTIRYQLPKNGIVTLKVYDILGNVVKTLVNETKEKGEHSVSFDASSLASGMYLYQIKAEGYVATKKMLLVK